MFRLFDLVNWVERESMNRKDSMASKDIDDGNNEEEEERMPGFRFHPTDEELVGFYLRRKVDKKPLSIELIKQIDIYTYDPWDLPKTSNLGDNEWYFFCKRVKKYKNSTRPNRVTGSGFWKVTNTDRPVFAQEGEGHGCIGLKKTLMYYLGRAGRGTKTEWIMHEFRLLGNNSSNPDHHAGNNTEEAEIWTLCRIMKRNASYRKHSSGWRKLPAKCDSAGTSSKPSSSCTVDSNTPLSDTNICSAQVLQQNHDQKPTTVYNHVNDLRHFHDGNNEWNQNHSHIVDHQLSSQHPSSSLNNNLDGNHDQLFTNANWDELRSVVRFALSPP